MVEKAESTWKMVKCRKALGVWQISVVQDTVGTRHEGCGEGKDPGKSLEKVGSCRPGRQGVCVGGCISLGQGPGVPWPLRIWEIVMSLVRDSAPSPKRLCQASRQRDN